MRLHDFPVPDTAAARAAATLAEAYQSPALTAHAVRSWYWAEGFAAVDGITAVDHELLYVAALLHDIGTVPEFDNVRTSYEHAGGHVAIALTTGAGWTGERRQRVLDVIVRHNWPSVDVSLDVEGHLLERATGLDISGADADGLPVDYLREVVRGSPAARSRPSSAPASSTRPTGSPTPLRGGSWTRGSSRSSGTTRSSGSAEADRHGREGAGDQARSSIDRAPGTGGAGSSDASGSSARAHFTVHRTSGCTRSHAAVTSSSGLSSGRCTRAA